MIIGYQSGKSKILYLVASLQVNVEFERRFRTTAVVKSLSKEWKIYRRAV